MRLVVSCKLLDCCGMRVVNTAQKISTMDFFRRDHLSPLTYNMNSPENVVIRHDTDTKKQDKFRGTQDMY